ncbi:MAG: iron export ABC transporter permease subunit FetB, partial [Planctomycetota bacterium]|nr:iron export ABC transporter permease subunit FetB [Planctomycetota bacterium]
MNVINAACALVAASPAADGGALDTGYVRIAPADLAWTLLLILCAVVLSRACRIGHEKSLLLGTVRSLVQLLAVGWLLRLIFRNEHWSFVALMVAVMIGIAAFDGKRRLEHRFKRALYVMLFSIGLATITTMATAIFLVFPVELWAKPQYVIPLAGMMTANALNSASLAVNRLAADVRLRKGEIEVALSLGATPAQASRRALRAAVRAAMTPALNMMMIVGIVQIPGMMSG